MSNPNFPMRFANWRPLIDKLAEVMHTEPHWDSEHRVLIFQRDEKARLRSGMLFEVELYFFKPVRLLFCWTDVEHVTSTGAFFAPSPLIYLSRFLLLKIIRMADRPACARIRQSTGRADKVGGRRKPKYKLHDLLAEMDGKFELTEEDRAWLDMPPVGREII